MKIYACLLMIGFGVFGSRPALGTGNPSTGYLPTDRFELFHVSGPEDEFKGCAAGVAFLFAGQAPFYFPQDTVLVKFFHDHTGQCAKDGKIFRQYSNCELIDSVYPQGGRFLQCHGRTDFYSWPETLDTEYSGTIMNKTFKVCENFKKYPDSSRRCRSFSGPHSSITRPLTD